jgi:anti-anti-sigma factor
MWAEDFGGSIEHAGDAATLSLHGEADLASRADFERLIAELLGTKARSLVVDVQEMRYLESACLRSLLHAHVTAGSDDRTLVVHGAKGIVRRVIEVAGVAELLDDSESPS